MANLISLSEYFSSSSSNICLIVFSKQSLDSLNALSFAILKDTPSLS